MADLSRIYFRWRSRQRVMTLLPSSVGSVSMPFAGEKTVGSHDSRVALDEMLNRWGLSVQYLTEEVDRGEMRGQTQFRPVPT